MKNKIFALLATFVFIASTLKCSAQQMPDMTSDGQAKLVVEKKRSKSETYIFPGDFPSGLHCVTHKGSSATDTNTDIWFVYQFNNSDGSNPVVEVYITIRPSGTGTFRLPINGDLSREAQMGVTIDRGESKTALSCDFPEDGTGGTVIIQNYPTKIGGKVKGVFEANLKSKKGEIYHVSGEFNIKRKAE